MLNKPIHFAPYLKSVIWGGERIAPYKGITTDQTAIGESWELSAVPGHISVVDRGPLAGQSLTQLIETYREELTKVRRKGMESNGRSGENQGGREASSGRNR